MLVVIEGSKAELIDFLLNLSSTEERAFEEAITDKLTQSKDSIVNDLYSILESSESLELRFRAFFGITVYQRRQNNPSEYKKIVDQYIDEFRDFSLHLHVLAIMYKEFGDREGILKSIEYSKMAIQKLNRHIGILNSFCESVVTAMEEDLNVGQDDIDNANSYIETVLMLKPDYAKFYCTKGRLLAQRGLFEEAQRNILHAIDIENSASNDYAMRISDYKNHLAIIKTKKLYSNVINEIEEAKKSVITSEKSIKNVVNNTKEQMEHMKTQNIQMLAFFTAIISFIIGSINIISKTENFDEAAMLMLILAGIMIIANVGFSVLLSSLKINLWKYTFVTIIGIGLIVAGLKI